jgi:hypothetical protein
MEGSQHTPGRPSSSRRVAKTGLIGQARSEDFLLDRCKAPAEHRSSQLGINQAQDSRKVTGNSFYIVPADPRPVIRSVFDPFPKNLHCRRHGTVGRSRQRSQHPARELEYTAERDQLEFLVMVTTFQWILVRRYPRFVGFAFFCRRALVLPVLGEPYHPGALVAHVSSRCCSPPALRLFLGWSSARCCTARSAITGRILLIGDFRVGFCLHRGGARRSAAALRLFNGNIVGSVTPLAIVSEWIAMVLAVLSWLRGAHSPSWAPHRSTLSLGTLLTIALVGEGGVPGALAPPHSLRDFPHSVPASGTGGS